MTISSAQQNNIYDYLNREFSQEFVQYQFNLFAVHVFLYHLDYMHVMRQERFQFVCLQCPYTFGAFLPHLQIPISISPYPDPHLQIPIPRFTSPDPHLQIPISRSPFLDLHLQIPTPNPHIQIPISRSLYPDPHIQIPISRYPSTDPHP